MFKFVMLSLVVVGISGCASSSRVDALEERVRIQSMVIQSLRDREVAEDDHMISMHNRLGSVEIRENSTEDTVDELNEKINRVFKKSSIK